MFSSVTHFFFLNKHIVTIRIKLYNEEPNQKKIIEQVQVFEEGVKILSLTAHISSNAKIYIMLKWLTACK
jgi:hypothetical protein